MKALRDLQARTKAAHDGTANGKLTMAEAFICDYIRTPIGRFGGALSTVRADDLGARAAEGADGAQSVVDGRRSTT